MKDAAQGGKPRAMRASRSDATDGEKALTAPFAKNSQARIQQMGGKGNLTQRNKNK